MKNKKMIAMIAGIGLVLFLSSFLNQQTPTQYITVRTIEYASILAAGGGGGLLKPDSKLVIVDETGEIHEYPLEKLTSSSIGENTKHITEVLNKLSKKGYTLINSSSGSLGENCIMNVFILKK